MSWPSLSWPSLSRRGPGRPGRPLGRCRGPVRHHRPPRRLPCGQGRRNRCSRPWLSPRRCPRIGSRLRLRPPRPPRLRPHGPAGRDPARRRGRSAVDRPRSAMDRPRSAMDRPRSAMDRPRSAVDGPRNAVDRPRNAMAARRRAHRRPPGRHPSRPGLRRPNPPGPRRPSRSGPRRPNPPGPRRPGRSGPRRPNPSWAAPPAPADASASPEPALPEHRPGCHWPARAWRYPSPRYPSPAIRARAMAEPAAGRARYGRARLWPSQLWRWSAPPSPLGATAWCPSPPWPNPHWPNPPCPSRSHQRMAIMPWPTRSLRPASPRRPASRGRARGVLLVRAACRAGPPGRAGAAGAAVLECSRWPRPCCHHRRPRSSQCRRPRPFPRRPGTYDRARPRRPLCRYRCSPPPPGLQ